MKNFIFTFGITLTLFLGVSFIVYIWDTQPDPEIESVRITVDSGTVKENTTGQEISTGEQLTVHANGTSEIISLNTPVPTAVNSPVISTGTREVNITVVDDEEQTIPNAVIALSTGLSLYCDNEGKATITLPENIATSATIAAENFFMKSEVPIGMDKSEVTITLNRKLAIHGSVFDPHGAPNTEAHLTIKESSAVLSATNNSFTFYPLVAGEHILLATHPTYFGISQTVPAGASVTINLKNEGTATITLKTSQNEIVANAELMFQSHPDEDFVYLTRGTTDINGKVSFTKLKRGFYTVNINHAWYVSPPILLEVDEANEQIELIIPDNQLELSGTVFDAETKLPLANIPVVSVLDHITSEGSALPSSQPATKTVMTNEIGQYIFNDLISGRYTVYVDDVEGYISGNQQLLKNYNEDTVHKVVLANLNAENFDFYLEKSWVVSGTVFDPNNKPLANQPVKLIINTKEPGEYDQYTSESAEEFGGKTITDQNGKYEMTVSASLPKKGSIRTLSEHKVYWDGKSETIEIKQGEKVDNVDIQFKGGCIVQGYVRNERGEPIANAFVQFTKEFKETHQSMEFTVSRGEYTHTNQNGFYECIFQYTDLQGQYIGIADAVYYESSVKHPTQKTVHVEASEKPLEVNFTLKQKEDETVEGIVVNENGEPVEGITVKLDVTTLLKQADSLINMQTRKHFVPKSKTDVNGHFEFDIDFVDTDLIQKQSDWGKILDKPRLITLSVSTEANDIYEHNYGHNLFKENLNDVRIELKKKQSNTEKTSIAGQVVSSDDKPIQNYEIMIVPGYANPAIPYIYIPKNAEQERSPFYQWTPVFSAEGRFQIDNLFVSHAPFYIGVRSNEYGIASSERLFPEANEIISGIKIVMGKGATIYGTVIDAQTGEPVSGINIVTLLPPSPAGQNDIGFQITKGRGAVDAEEQMQSLMNGSLPTATTNEKGEFILKGAPVPSTFLHILPSNNYDQYTIPIRPLTDGQTRKIDPIRLKPLNPVPVERNE